ncbi:HPr family phosphocarrier protein [Actinotalea sp. BY-33]|uniref:Phosphocarrier protein HPr n=1 Tax=Actinotalea soli TaxID=2819234 RepID=A0A939LPA2_9CELL|nr:HPr family phosphocarrier protein [Actinotalea soli]MBO1751741.1 HPr family phosphocarrier protein [Actinotalea soli]
MLQRRATIRSSSGLHARPASHFTQAVAATGLPITIARAGGEGVPASSVLMVMGMALDHGEEVVLASESTEAEAALEELVALLETDLDADS